MYSARRLWATVPPGGLGDLGRSFRWGFLLTYESTNPFFSSIRLPMSGLLKKIYSFMLQDQTHTDGIANLEC
jgi:hypothetical protein